MPTCQHQLANEKTAGTVTSRSCGADWSLHLNSSFKITLWKKSCTRQTGDGTLFLVCEKTGKRPTPTAVCLQPRHSSFVCHISTFLPYVHLFLFSTFSPLSTPVAHNTSWQRLIMPRRDDCGVSTKEVPRAPRLATERPEFLYNDKSRTWAMRERGVEGGRREVEGPTHKRIITYMYIYNMYTFCRHRKDNKYGSMGRNMCTWLCAIETMLSSPACYKRTTGRAA